MSQQDNPSGSAAAVELVALQLDGVTAQELAAAKDDILPILERLRRTSAPDLVWTEGATA